MRQLRVGKVVVNICTGKSGEPLQKAMKVLEQITGHKPCQRKAKRTIRDWGIRKGEPIACMVTLRGKEAMEFLKKAFEAAGNRISASSFDAFGNFSFGVKEHIQFPSVRYDPSIGIFGMDICVTLERAGYRVERRKRLRSKVGRPHLISSGEAINYVRELFGIEVK
jgi:large subunit ribosomal protein L5